ncbi:MAG: UbiD family decarboxylase [Acidobacteria bacterium]|nr:UbiD family decarboxylase [Acidobacteriota bacterium]
MGFAELRTWLDRFEASGELRRIKAEVNWDREVGTIARRSFTSKGPALLFENIQGHQATACTKLATALLNKRSRLAMVLGFPPDATVRELVQYVRRKNRETIPPVEVKTGPVKDNIIRGGDVDLYQFPVPRWHFRDGGRYILTFAGIVTRDPDTGILNMGVYRGMISQRNTIPILIIASQHGGQTFTKYKQRKKPMPVAAVIGYDPIMDFLSGSPVPSGVCEYDVMGAYRGEPLQVVRCETNDLLVPAGAEIVIEGYVDPDPKTYAMEGPFGEYTGHTSDIPAPRPLIQVECITYRDDPILRGTQEGTLPGSYNENSMMSSIQRAAIAWNILEQQGVPGVTNVHVHPVTNGTNICVAINKRYEGHAKQVAAALWGSGAALYRYKHVIVVDDDIDISDYEQLDWAIAYRVNAGKDDIVVFPSSFGSPIDPSTPLAERDVPKLGAGIWNRVLVDATRTWMYDPRPEWDGRFPPTVHPAPEDEALVDRRWSEYGWD